MRYLFLLLPFFLITACQQQKEEIQEIEVKKIIASDAEPGMIHTVYFWMNDDVDAAAEKAFQDGMMALGTIPSVKRMFAGPAAPTAKRDVTDNSFDYSLILWFDDVDGHNAYQVHDIHTKFAEEQGPKFKRVQVYDNLVK